MLTSHLFEFIRLLTTLPRIGPLAVSHVRVVVVAAVMVTVPVDVSVSVGMTMGVVIEVSINVVVSAVSLALDRTLLNRYESTLDSRNSDSGYSSL